MLALRSRPSTLARLKQPRLERAIGVIYRPETELQSHYFEAVLPSQFDEYIWLNETTAVHPIRTEELTGVPNTYPSAFRSIGALPSLQPGRLSPFAYLTV